MDAVHINAAAALAAAATLAVAGVHIEPVDLRSGIAWHQCRTGPEDELGGELDAAARGAARSPSRRPATDPGRRIGTPGEHR